ncbi:MAG TPA: hypothetical protein VIQ03_11830 [Gammaproteobacteria bacterium]
MEIKDTIKEKLETERANWDAQINILSAKAENANQEVRATYLKELDELRRKQQEATEKLKQLEHTSGDAWQQFKGTTNHLWSDFKTGVARAMSKFH